MCFINSTPLIAIIDIGATHSFIASSCVECLGLVLTLVLRGMVIHTPANGLVTCHTPNFDHFSLFLSNLFVFLKLGIFVVSDEISAGRLL